MPEMDMTNIPEVPLVFRPGDESAGLEIVDVVLWVAKRHIEGKALSPELIAMLSAFAKRGLTDEVSLLGIQRRWAFLIDLPEGKDPLPEDLQARLEQWETDRQKAVESCR